MGRKKIILTARERKVIEKVRPYKRATVLGALRGRRKKLRAQKHEWYLANRERTRERDKKWRESHKDYNKKWRLENKERIKSYADRQKARDPEKLRENDRRWRENNPDKVKIRWNNYRGRKLGNGGKLSKDICKRLRISQKNKCAICGRSILTKGYHLDHIIPLFLGGENGDANVQLTCPSCNLSKGKKDPKLFIWHNKKLK